MIQAMPEATRWTILVARLRAIHVPVTVEWWDEQPVTRCAECSQLWPCRTRQAVDQGEPEK